MNNKPSVVGVRSVWNHRVSPKECSHPPPPPPVFSGDPRWRGLPMQQVTRYQLSTPSSHCVLAGGGGPSGHFILICFKAVGVRITPPG